MKALRSRKLLVSLGVVAAYLAWQGWLTLAAAGKIAPGLESAGEKVNILVTLPFPPERFHVIAFQKHGRVSGTDGTSIEVRGVRTAELRAVARPYWVRRVEPLPPGG